MMSSCCTFRLNRRRALSKVSPSCTVTSAKSNHLPRCPDLKPVRRRQRAYKLFLNAPHAAEQIHQPSIMIEVGEHTPQPAPVAEKTSRCNRSSRFYSPVEPVSAFHPLQ